MASEAETATRFAEWLVTVAPSAGFWSVVMSGVALLSRKGWAGLKSAAEFIKPHIVGFFTDHKDLVETLKKSTEQSAKANQQSAEALNVIRGEVQTQGKKITEIHVEIMRGKQQ